MATGNPFWDVHDVLWDLLEAKTTFTSKVGKKLNFTESFRTPLPDVASASDFPMVMVWPAGFVAQDRDSSNCTRITLQWEVLVHSGEMPLDPIFDIQWGIFAALIDWDTDMYAITWGSENPVKNCDIMSVRESLYDDATGPGARGLPDYNIRGWRSVWVGRTDLWFNHTNLQAIA